MAGLAAPREPGRAAAHPAVGAVLPPRRVLAPLAVLGCTFPQNTLGKFLWKAPVLSASGTWNPAAAGRPQSLSLSSQPRGLHAQPLLAPIPAALPHPLLTQAAATSPRCISLYPKTFCTQAESRCANLSHPTAPPVELSLYYESLCPACRGFLVEQLFTTWLLLPSETMNITLVPYGNAQEKKVGGKWQFQCQHGSEECLGNMIQACLMHEAENFTTYFPVIFCMESGTSATKNLEACLQVYAPQLDAGRIAACVRGDLGTTLMHRNAQLTEALDPPHQYVPWIVVNGKHTDELQEQAQRSLLRLVCQLYQGEKPEGCQSAAAPKPREVCKR